MPEPADRGTPTFPRCPECGWSDADSNLHTRRRPRLIGWTLSLVLAGALMFLGTRTTSSFTGGPVYLGTTVVEPVFTRADLRAIADGQSIIRSGKPIELASTLLSSRKPSPLGFGEARLQALLIAPPPGSEVNYIRCGYPFKWLTIATARHYTDVANRAGPLIGVTNPGTGIRPKLGTTHARPGGIKLTGSDFTWNIAPERTAGAVVDITITFAHLVATLALALLAGSLVSALIAAILHARDARHQRTSPRLIPVGLCAFLTASIVALAIVSVPKSNVYVWTSAPRASVPGRVVGIDTSLDTGASLTTISLDRLRSFPTSQDADQALAADILAVCADAPAASPTDVLFAAACIENWNAIGKFTDVSGILPVVSIASIQHERCPDFGVREPVSMPRTTRASVSWNAITLLHAPGQPGAPVSEVTIFPPAIIAALAVIFTPSLGPTLLRKRSQRRISSALRRGSCPSCAYPLPFSPTP